MAHDKMQCWKTKYRWTDQRRVFVEAAVRSTHLKLKHKKKNTEKLIMSHEKMQCWKTYNRWTDQRRVFVEAVVMSTHQVDGHYEVMLLVSLPLLRLLATFD